MKDLKNIIEMKSTKKKWRKGKMKTFKKNYQSVLLSPKLTVQAILDLKECNQ